MNCITLIIKFEDGQEMAFIGPEQSVPAADIESVWFSEPEPMQDIRLSEITQFTHTKGATAH